MEKQIILSCEQTFYKIFEENGNVEGGFNYTLRHLMTIEEAAEALSKLKVEHK